MKKIIFALQAIILFLFFILLSQYFWLEEVFILFLLPIIIVFIIAGIFALTNRIFRKIKYKKIITFSFFTVPILQIFLCIFIIWSVYPRSFSKDQVSKDLDNSIALLEDIHPDLYAVIDKNSFAYIIDSVKTSLPKEMTDIEVYKIFASLISHIRDGHTGLTLDNFINRGSAFFRKVPPYRFKIKDDRLYLVENFYLRNNVPVGSEIISINNKPICQCINETSRLISYETIPYRNAWLQLPIFWGLWNNFQEITITYKTPDSIKNTVTTSSGLFANWSYLWDITGGFGTHNYSYELRNGDIAYIKLKTFNNLDTFKKFLTATFSDIKQKEIENLIIDIRNSTGGATSVSEEFMQYISPVAYTTFDTSLLKISDHLLAKYTLDTTKYKPGSLYLEKRGLNDLRENPYRFTGSCYILINEFCFSTSLDFPAMARYFKVGKLIGTETGGRTKSFGSPVTVSLPETGIILKISRKKFVNVGGVESERGLIPDHIVENSIEDEIKGIDRALDHTISLIRLSQ